MVTIEDVATADPHPKVLNLTSSITSSPASFLPTLMKISIKSPQTGFPTLPYPSGFSITPTFLGFLKWSNTFSEYCVDFILIIHLIILF